VASGTLITTFKQKVSVGAGKTATVSGPLVAIPRVSDGTYFIVAQVTDSSGGVTTVKFGTPVKIAAAKIDLVNNSVTVPATAKRGASVPIAISVTNVGNVVASGPLHIAISVSTFADGSNAIFVGTLLTQMNVKPGGTQTLHLTGKVTPGVPTGRLFLVADLDPTDLVGDVNLANNVKVSGRSILVS
jgi:hypothetical protein